MTVRERCVRATISGTVQGVGFRGFTERELRALGATGYVRNLADGRVEAVIEGDSEVVDLALAILSEGPRGARVADVALEEISVQGHASFAIRH